MIFISDIDVFELYTPVWSLVFFMNELWFSDIDECARGVHTCESDQECVNTAGSFGCTCGAGYRRDSQGNCEGEEEIAFSYLMYNKLLQ